MKNTEKFLLGLLLFILCLFPSFNIIGNKMLNKERLDMALSAQTISDLVHQNDSLNNILNTIHEYYEGEIDWILFKLALIKVESNFVFDAQNPSGATGIYQIMPMNTSGFLDEANRLLGFNAFTNSCRLDPIKSNQIFEIINSKRNPDRSMDVAIKLHNPGAGSWYKDRIMDNFNLFKEISYTKYDTLPMEMISISQSIDPPGYTGLYSMLLILKNRTGEQ